MADAPSLIPSVVERMYQETMRLFEDTRDYMLDNPLRGAPGPLAIARLRNACLRTRHTAELSDVMAWMAVQRAYFVGEMSAEEAAAESAVFANGARDGDPAAPEVEAPEALRALIARRRALVARVLRLHKTLPAIPV